MRMQYTPYSSIFAVTALISTTVALIIWRRRSTRGGLPLALMMAAVTEWALMAALEAANQGFLMFLAPLHAIVSGKHRGINGIC